MRSLLIVAGWAGLVVFLFGLFTGLMALSGCAFVLMLFCGISAGARER